MIKHWLLWAVCGAIALATLAAEHLFIQHITPKEANVLAVTPTVPKPVVTTHPPKPSPWWKDAVSPDSPREGMIIQGHASPHGELPVYRFVVPVGQYTLPLKRGTVLTEAMQIKDWTNRHEVSLTNLFSIAYPDTVYRETNAWPVMTIFYWCVVTNGSHLVRITNSTEVLFQPAWTQVNLEIRAANRHLTKTLVDFDGPP